MHASKCSHQSARCQQQQLLQQQQQQRLLLSQRSLAPAALQCSRSRCQLVQPVAAQARLSQVAPAAHMQLQQQQLHTAPLPQQQQQRLHQQQQRCHPQQLLHRQRLQGSSSASAATLSGSCIHSSWQLLHHHQQQQQQRGYVRASAATAAADGFDSSSEVPHSPGSTSKAIPLRIEAAADQETYSLRDTQVLVETAMLSAVSGLSFLLSTLLKLDNSLGYFLPLPITIAACRSGVAAGWHTMMATAFLLLVLLGPLRAITYVLMHGVLAASLGSMWVWKWPWAISIPAGAVLRMAGQLGYLVLSSVTMNENLFQVMLANVHNLLDQLSAAVGSYGSPSTLAIISMIFALLLVNGICYVFLIHVVYHVILGSMGFKLGALPGFVRKYLYAGVPQQQQQQQQQ